MGTRLGRERDDGLTLVLAVLVVPVTWLLLGWTWPRALAGHDGLAHDLLMIREVAAGGWSSLVYRADLLGGFKGRDALGPFPLFPLLAGFGLPPLGIAVGATFVVQALLGFLGARAAADVAGVWSDGARALTWFERLAVVWLCAFAPALGWRVGFGHLNLVIGLLAFAAGLALVAAAAARTPTIVLVAVSTVAFVLALLSPGQQIVVYGLIFGGPLLLGAWISLGARWRALPVVALVPIGAVLIALPGLWGMLVQARSSDAPRRFADVAVTYDVITASARDWLTSVPWTGAVVPAGGKPLSLPHEINYPAGPLLVLLLLVPWRRARALAAGMALSLLAVLVFSMDLAPLSRAMLAAIPPLRSFRIPARAALPWLWLLAVLAVAALAHRDLAREAPAQPRAKRRREPQTTTLSWVRSSAVLFGLAAGVALVFAPSPAREVAAWAVAAAMAVLILTGRESMPAVFALLLLSICGLAAFHERLLPFPDAPAFLAEAESLGTTVRGAKPETESSLTRVRMGIDIPVFAANTAFAADLSALDGYAIPTRRFSALFFAIRGDPYQPTAVFFKFVPSDPAFQVYRQLYNVTLDATLPSRGRLTLAPLGATAGPAWFSASVARADGVAALARELRAAGDALAARAREVLWLDSTDPLAAGAPATVDAGCRAARVTRVTAARRSPEIVVEVETAAACPLTLATNFTEDLRATAVLGDGTRVVAAMFPAYGPLAGVHVPAGTRTVRVIAEPPRLPFGPAWTALGIVCCAGAAWMARRS